MPCLICELDETPAIRRPFKLAQYLVTLTSYDRPIPKFFKSDQYLCKPCVKRSRRTVCQHCSGPSNVGVSQTVKVIDHIHYPVGSLLCTVCRRPRDICVVCQAVDVKVSLLKCDRIIGETHFFAGQPWCEKCRNCEYRR